ncbi:MAG TPA: glycosyltransferase family 4 protein [Acidimicrobiia bacterium]|nr:glycosyltransferase family 4 protein [Acidimicrobiia bacterium]
MKLTFVTPRAGDDIVGGAEHAIFMLAENCAKYSDIEVQILATTAGDERTWSPRYAQGREVVGGIDVCRYPNEPINRSVFDYWAQPLLENPGRVTPSQFDEWLTKQGPYSPELLDAIENCESDALVFHPMLSSPTSHGVFRTQRPVVIHPAFHDEPLSRMPGYQGVIHRADLIAFSTRYEQQLAGDILGTALQRQSVIGFGVDAPTKVESAASAHVLAQYGLASSRYAIVIGRVDAAKGADLCYDMFNAFNSSLTNIDKLAFVGPVSDSSHVTNSDRVVVAGSVDDETKWALLSQAQCLISPSVTESFSLVVLEAMKVGVPVIVNGLCGPTQEHVSRSLAGTSFTNSAEFVSALNVCSEDSSQRDKMIKRGRNYVNDFYDWENLIGRYREVVEVAVSASTN